MIEQSRYFSVRKEKLSKGWQRSAVGISWRKPECLRSGDIKDVKTYFMDFVVFRDANFVSWPSIFKHSLK